MNTKVLYLQAGKPLVYVRSKVNLFGLLGATVFLKSLPDFLLNGPKMAEGSVVGSSLPNSIESSIMGWGRAWGNAAAAQKQHGLRAVGVGCVHHFDLHHQV